MGLTFKRRRYFGKCEGKKKKGGGGWNATLHGSHAFKFVVPRAKNTMSVDNKLKLVNSY